MPNENGERRGLRRTCGETERIGKSVAAGVDDDAPPLLPTPARPEFCKCCCGSAPRLVGAGICTLNFGRLPLRAVGGGGKSSGIGNDGAVLVDVDCALLGVSANADSADARLRRAALDSAALIGGGNISCAASPSAVDALFVDVLALLALLLAPRLAALAPLFPPRSFSNLSNLR